MAPVQFFQFSYISLEICERKLLTLLFKLPDKFGTYTEKLYGMDRIKGLLTLEELIFLSEDSVEKDYRLINRRIVTLLLEAIKNKDNY